MLFDEPSKASLKNTLILCALIAEKFKEAAQFIEFRFPSPIITPTEGRCDLGSHEGGALLPCTHTHTHPK